MPQSKFYGHLIRDARKQRGETLEQVAADLGKAPGSLKNVENGRADPGDELAAALADRYGIPLEDLWNQDRTVTHMVPVAPLSDRIALNTIDAAVMCGVKPYTIRESILAGELPAALIGQGYVIFPEDLKQWIESKKQQTSDLKKTA